MNQRRASLALGAALTFALAAGCHKKQAPPPPPPPPQTQAPVANKPVVSYFSAEPTAVDKGQPSSLRWSVTDANSVTIDNNVGDVSPSGRKAVYPNDTTTYTLTATGAGGTATASVTVTVNTPPAAPPAQAAPPQQSAAEILANRVQDVHFGYDKSDIVPEDQAILQSDASALKQIFGMDPNFVVTLEGHCDERGSAEYNLALGDRRAAAIKDALTQMGLPADKLKTISYGKERPLCTDASEECYARNRRVHFSANQ